MGIKMARFLSFEKLTCWYLFALVPVWVPLSFFPHEKNSGDLVLVLELLFPESIGAGFLSKAPHRSLYTFAYSCADRSRTSGHESLAPPVSGKEKAHKHKQIFPVTARVGGGLPTGWPEVSRPAARGQKFMCCVRNPRNINIFVRAPGREESGSRPGGSVTGVTEKLFMCQMFMCLFRPVSGIWEAKIFTEKMWETKDFCRKKAGNRRIFQKSVCPM